MAWSADCGMMPVVSTQTGLAYAALAMSALCYGISSLLLSRGADVVRGRIYLAGLVAQAAGFGLSFLSRTEAPLMLVQAGVSASVGVTAVLGAMLGRWRLTLRDTAAVATLVLGLSAVGAAADPGGADSLPTAGLAMCLLVTVATGLSARLPLPAAALGAMAGLGYGASAIAARAVAGRTQILADRPQAVVLLILVVAGIVVGQMALTVAFRRGRRTHAENTGAVVGPVAAMYLVATVWPAAVGVAWLGDLVRPGWGPIAVLGLALAMSGTVILARLEISGDPDPLEDRRRGTGGSRTVWRRTHL